MLPRARVAVFARLIYDYVPTSDGAFYTFLTARFIAFADAWQVFQIVNYYSCAQYGPAH